MATFSATPPSASRVFNGDPHGAGLTNGDEGSRPAPSRREREGLRAALIGAVTVRERLPSPPNATRLQRSRLPPAFNKVRLDYQGNPRYIMCHQEIYMIMSYGTTSRPGFGQVPILAFTLLFAAATFATAQTKHSGIGKCGKPAKQEMIEVGDRANHALVIAQLTCSWSTAMEIAGLKSKDYTATVTSDSNSGKSQDRGYVVIVMDNGDKAFVKFQGAGTSSKEGATTGGGTWSYAGGTGKLRGITGKGSYKSSGNADGIEDQVEGDYTLPDPSASKATKK
jgi:hypothetical protein